MKFPWLKLLITGIAIGLIVVHLVRPDVGIDAITLGLLIVAILPWLTSVIESAEFPGGWKVKFRDIANAEKAVEEVQQAAPRSKRSKEKGQDKGFMYFRVPDANLVLVSLRIEIERRVRVLLEKNEIVEDPSLYRNLEKLAEREILDQDITEGLQDLVKAGNRAAHGATVDKQVGEWAQEFAPDFLAYLDTKIKG